MSDGGKERRKSHETNDAPRKPGSDSFSRAIVRVAVGQICHNEGFQAFQQSALETLSDIVIRYMLNIGKMAVSTANSAGRTEPNAFDIIHGIEDLHSGVGLSGASCIDQCLLNSGMVKEILSYVYKSDEIPFAYPLPSFPVSKEWRPSQSFTQSGDEPPNEHIPAWMPKFPNCLALKENESLKVQKSLSNLCNDITCNGSGLSKDMKEEKNPGTNPFLAEPICSVGKDASPVILPSKSDLQFMNEVVGNHIEGKQACRDKSNELNPAPKDVPLKQRPAVQFKIKSSKKFLHLPLHSSFQEEGAHKSVHSLMYDNGNDVDGERLEKAAKESSPNGLK